MKTFTSLLAVTGYLLFNNIQAQTLSIPCGSATTTDGVVHPAEWADADSIAINIQGNRSITILHKHDSLQLYFAFLGHLQSSNIRFPEVMIDTDHSKGGSWDNQDWWFHVSATDCEYQGEHSNYDSCATQRPNWKGAPNMPAGIPEPPYIDTMEISIPISTLGTLGITFGIAFDVTNTFNSWEYWPENANIDEPMTWASASLESCNPASLPPSQSMQPSMFPNPGSDNITLRFDTQSDLETSIEVYSILGSTVHCATIPKGCIEYNLSISEWPKGHYLLVHKLESSLSRQVFEKR